MSEKQVVTFVVEFDAPGPVVAANTDVMGGRLLSATFGDLESIARREALEEAAKVLRGMADTQYCLGMDAIREVPCLGWEQKVKSGEFGKAEMDAHKKANEHFGAHFAMHASAREIEALTKKDVTE